MTTPQTHDNGAVPDGWRWARVEDVAEVNPRKPVLGVDPDRLVTFIPMASVAENLAGIRTSEQRPFREVSNGYTYFEENDVLFAKITPCLQNGKHALATGLTSGIGFGTTEFHVIRPGAGIDPRHLFRVLTQQPNIDKCTKSFAGTAGQQRVQPDTLKSLTFLLPPLAEQRTIAAVLDSIDGAIERTEEVIAATEALRDSLLHELLTRGVPGWHTEWKEVPGIGTIPADWHVVRLGDVCEPPQYGAGAAARPYDPNLPRYVRITDLTDDGELSPEDPRSADPLQVAGYELRDGDLLFARSGSVGRTYLYREADGPCVYAGYLIKFRADPGRVLPSFLEAWTHSQPYFRWIETVARRGAQTTINAREYSRMSLPLPQLHEQNAISEMLEAVDASLANVKNTLMIYRSIKSSAAETLLSGMG